MICFDAPRHQQSHTSVENPDSLNVKKYIFFNSCNSLLIFFLAAYINVTYFIFSAKTKKYIMKK